MSEPISPYKLEQPAGIGEALKPTRDEGMSTQALHIPEVVKSKPNIEFIKPFIITEIIRNNGGPFYDVGTSIEEKPLGIEDKMAGREDIIRSRETAGQDIAEYAADRGKKILRGMALLHGEDYAARARALVKPGAKLAPETSPQGKTDLQIVGHLEQAIASFIGGLNSNITPEADNFRKKLYAELERLGREHGTDDPNKILELYRSGAIRLKPDNDLGYPKEHISSVIERMEPSRRSSWRFMQSAIRYLSDPKSRSNSSKLSAQVV